MRGQPQPPIVPVPIYQPTPQEVALGQRLDALALADIRGAGAWRLPRAPEYAGWMATPQVKLFRPSRPVPAITVRRHRKARGIRPDTPGRRAMRANLGQ
jgi:hypothetical protein